MAEYTLDDLIEAMQYIDSQNIQDMTAFIEYSKIYDRDKWLAMLDNADYYESLLNKLKARKKYTKNLHKEPNKEQKKQMQFINKESKGIQKRNGMERTRERILKVTNNE